MSTPSRPLRDAFVEAKLNNVLKPLGIAQGLCWLAIVASPFLWIWGSWSLCWKTALTGFIAAFAIGLIGRYLRSVVKTSLDKACDKFLQNLNNRKF